MFKSIASAAAIAVSVATVSYAQNRPLDNPVGNTPAVVPGDRASLDPKSQKHDDLEFIKEAATSNAFEIQLGQWVQQHSQDAQVKQVAERIIMDHQQSQQQLKDVAKSVGTAADEPLSQAQQAMLGEFQKKQGPALDRAYLFSNVGDHHKAILCYEWEARNAENAQLKQYCEQTLPHLREHLQHVNQTAMAVTGVNDAQTASERMPGAGAPTHSGTQSDRPAAGAGNAGSSTPTSGNNGR